jgi:photosystem II stability/assembly factor-like uncharacterized protein
VWYHNNGFGAGHYGDGELKSLPLAAAFAGAGNPPFPLTPTPVPTPLPVSANLNAISYFAIDEGWAVGDGGAMLFWDGGDRWQPQRPTTSRDLRAIDILPSDNGPAVGWAVGDGVIVRAGFGDTPISIEGQLNSVEIISPDDAWAAGKADSPGGGSPNAGGAPLIMHYDGTSWQRVSLPFTGYGLSAVDMVSPTEGWAVGDGPTLHYSGGVWSEVPLPGQVHLNGVAMISHTEGWAVGDGGIIMHYSSGQWQVAASPSRARLRAVAMSSGSSGEGFAVGDSGTILHYIGGTWSVSPNPTTANLRGLQRRLDVAVGAVGEGGVVLSYHEPNGWVQEQARPYGP